LNALCVEAKIGEANVAFVFKCLVFGALLSGGDVVSPVAVEVREMSRREPHRAGVFAAAVSFGDYVDACRYGRER
jgi:hypothetical protein